MVARKSRKSRKSTPVDKSLNALAHVEVSKGITRTTGEYETVRLNVSVRMPCSPEEVEETEKHLDNLTFEMLKGEYDAYTQEEI